LTGEAVVKKVVAAIVMIWIFALWFEVCCGMACVVLLLEIGTSSSELVLVSKGVLRLGVCLLIVDADDQSRFQIRASRRTYIGNGCLAMPSFNVYGRPSPIAWPVAMLA